jgi:hypothetical protein
VIGQITSEEYASYVIWSLTDFSVVCVRRLAEEDSEIYLWGGMQHPTDASDDLNVHASTVYKNNSIVTVIVEHVGFLFIVLRLPRKRHPNESASGSSSSTFEAFMVTVSSLPFFPNSYRHHQGMWMSPLLHLGIVWVLFGSQATWRLW